MGEGRTPAEVFSPPPGVSKGGFIAFAGVVKGVAMGDKVLMERASVGEGGMTDAGENADVSGSEIWKLEERKPFGTFLRDAAVCAAVDGQGSGTFLLATGCPPCESAKAGSVSVCDGDSLNGFLSPSVSFISIS